MPSLFLLRAGCGAVSQSSGRDVAFRPFGLLNLFPVFQCDMVVGAFFMSFLGGKLFLRKKSWCVRFQHCGYQAVAASEQGVEGHHCCKSDLCYQ